MPNKYNVRAKRLALDNLIRKRAWTTFETSFHQLAARDNENHDRDAAGDGGGGDAKKSEGDANLCRSVVRCRNHQTTHRTLLHSLCDIPSCRSPPPSDLIRLVASACPRSLLLHESGSERTPLHLAIDQGTSLGTIQALMEATDDDDSLKRQDLLLALDSKLQTPLLSAVRRGVDVDDDIVKYLVNQDIDGASLLVSWKKKHQQQHAGVPLKYVVSRESIFVGEGLDNSRDLLRFMIVRTYRAKLKKSFSLLYNNSDGYEGRNQDNINQTVSTIDIDVNTCLLQSTIFCYELIGSSKIASSMLSHIIRNRLFHRERLDSRQDYAGNLTLHIACLSDAPKFDRILRLGDRESDYGLNSEDCTLMEYLIHSNPYPCTAPYLSKNLHGDIPLHCAIKSGKDRSQIQLMIEACPCSVKAFTAKGELPLHLAIKFGNPITDIMELWNCYPDAASIVDISTGLYPFLLAAIFGNKQKPGKGKIRKKIRSKEGTHSDDTCGKTSLSYFMLRECPSLIASSLLSTG